MKIENAKWTDVEKTSLTGSFDGLNFTVPADLGNRHYTEFMRQVAEEGLVIEDADPIVKPIRRIGKPREFLHLFTDTEKAAFFTAKQSNVQLELWWAEASTGDFSLDHPTVALGLAGLVQAGILTQVRADDIQNADFNTT